MNREEMTRLVVDTLCEIAPDLRGIDLKPDADIRREYDLDSVDYLAFVQSVHKRTGKNIPDSDYVKFSTIDGAVSYLLGSQN